MAQLAQVKKAVNFINKQTKNFKPEIALIAGSGLGWAVPPLDNKVIVPYTTIPGFLQSTVPGHAGNLIFGSYKGHNVVIMQGRFHFYEGYQMKEFAISVRTLKLLGVQKLIVSGAVGSMDLKLRPGALCVLKDHINFMCNNPLIGNSREPEFGPMFFDMSTAYDKDMRKITLAACKKIGLRAREGVYISVTGPNFETPSEIKMFKKMGASVVGMSVVPEVLVARQCGIQVLGLAVVTNMACGIEKKPLSHEQTIRESKKAEVNFKKLMEILFVKL